MGYLGTFILGLIHWVLRENNTQSSYSERQHLFKPKTTSVNDDVSPRLIHVLIIHVLITQGFMNSSSSRVLYSNKLLHGHEKLRFKWRWARPEPQVESSARDNAHWDARNTATSLQWGLPLPINAFSTLKNLTEQMRPSFKHLWYVHILFTLQTVCYCTDCWIPARDRKDGVPGSTEWLL